MTNKNKPFYTYCSTQGERENAEAEAAFLAEMDRADLWAGIKVALVFAALGASALALVYFTHTVQAGCLYYLGL
jgi:hypothetical protein